MVYNEKVMDIFQNPKNVGKLKGANAIGQVGNVACGDIMKIYLKINENDIIEDASFETFGCAAAIVSSSIATEIIKGWTVEQALNFDNNMIIKEVGELPVHKIHCSVLAKEAIEDAIIKYRKKQAKESKKEAKKTTEIVKENIEIKEKHAKKSKEVKEIVKPSKISSKEEKVEEYQPIKAKGLIAKEEKTSSISGDFKSALSALRNVKSIKADEKHVVEEAPKKQTKSKKEEKAKNVSKSEVIKEEVFEFDNKSLKNINKDLKKEEKQKKTNVKKLDKNFLSLTKRINKL